VIAVRLEIAAMIAVLTAVRVATVLTSGAAGAVSGAAGEVAEVAVAGVISVRAEVAICLPPSTLLRKAANEIVAMTAGTVEIAAMIVAVAIPIAAATKIVVRAVRLTIAAPKLLVLQVQPNPAKTIFCFPVNRWPNIVAALLSRLPLRLP
jgi:hypothetical protein